MLEDAELLRRYADSRSEEAFAELVQRRIGLVYSVALRRTGDARRAEEVTQTVFNDLARKADLLARRPLLAGWLYRSAHFAAATLMRSERNRRARETEAYTMNEILSDNGADRGWEQARPLLDEIMSELNEGDRDALMLRFFDDRPFVEVGRRLGLTENAARMRVERALDKFHAQLARRGVRSTSAALGLALAQQAVAAASAPLGLAASISSSALAAGGVAASPWVNLFYFMSSQKIAVGAAALVLAGGVGTAVSEVYFRYEASRVSNLGSGSSASLERLQDLQRRALNEERLTTERQAALAAARDREAARKARLMAEARALEAGNRAEASAFLARHPEVKAAAMRSRRMVLAGNYQPLFTMLSLSPDQIQRFLDLVVQTSRGSMIGRDGSSIAYDFGDAATARNQLRELLGEEGYKRYDEYFDHVGPAFSTTTRVAGALYRSSTPIAPEQGKQLFEILLEERAPVEWASRPQYDWSTIIAKAQLILSGTQLDAVKHERAQDEFSQAFTQSRQSADAARRAAANGE